MDKKKKAKVGHSENVEQVENDVESLGEWRTL